MSNENISINVELVKQNIDSTVVEAEKINTDVGAKTTITANLQTIVPEQEVINVETEDDESIIVEMTASGPKGSDGKSLEFTWRGSELGVRQTGDTTFQYVDLSQSASYVHDQIMAAKVWQIRHNLGRYPQITIVDTAGSVVEGDKHYDDINNITLTFSAEFSGKAFLA
jgi:hypothetical protein